MSSQRWALSLAGLWGLWALAGCAARTPEPVAPTSTPPAIVTSSPAELSEAALKVMAERLIRALNAKDAATISDLVDEATFVESVMRRISDTTLRMKAAVQAGAIGKRAMGIFSFAPYVDWRLIKVSISKGEGRILLSGTSNLGGGYVECWVRQRGPTLQVVDIALFLREQPLSLDLATLILAIAAQKGDMEEQYISFQKLMTAGKYAEALKMYDSFPRAVQAQALAAFCQLSIAAAVDLETFLRALDRYLISLPKGTPTNELHYKAWYYSGHKEEMIEAIREVRKRVELQDSTLDFQEAVALGRLGRFQEGRAILTATLERDPEDEAAKWGLMKIAMLEKNYEEGAFWLDRLLPSNPDLPVKIHQREDCQAFLATPIGKEWLAKAEARPAASDKPANPPDGGK